MNQSDSILDIKNVFRITICIVIYTEKLSHNIRVPLCRYNVYLIIYIYICFVGENGAPGKDGTNGVDGKDGTPGTPGAAGKL